jgi:hypothetical protein
MGADIVIAVDALPRFCPSINRTFISVMDQSISLQTEQNAEKAESGVLLKPDLEKYAAATTRSFQIVKQGEAGEKTHAERKALATGIPPSPCSCIS